MKKIGLYLADGEIDTTVTCPDSMVALQGGEGLTRIDLDNIEEADTHYVDVDTQTVMAKQPMPLITTNTPIIANGTDEVIISGIPSGAQVEWPDRQTGIVNDGEIGFSVDLAGTYTFQFTTVPYLDKEITVEAIAAT